MKFYLHVLDLQTNKANKETYIFNSTDDETLWDLVEKVCLKYASEPEQIQIAQDSNSKSILNHSMLLNSFFNDNSGIFVTINKPKPVLKDVPKEQSKVEHFQPITKYTFYELDDMNVRVILELKDIGKLPKESFSSRFLERSFEIKIRDFNGKNWIFGVGRTMNKISNEGSRFTVKPDKILITLRKQKKEDNWFSLVKVKTIGGHDSD